MLQCFCQDTSLEIGRFITSELNTWQNALSRLGRKRPGVVSWQTNEREGAFVMDEIWKPVPGCEGTYEVSDKGQVRSLPREVKGRTRQGQIRKASSTKDGYLRLNLWVNGKQQSRLVHQLVIEAFIGPPGPDQEVHHVNNNKTDNRLGNLRYVTHKWNVRLYWETNEAVANTLRGNDHPRSKMTEKKVRQLRQDYATGDWTFVNLGKKYGIAPNTAEGIIKRQTWVHVE